MEMAEPFRLRNNYLYCYLAAIASLKKLSVRLKKNQVQLHLLIVDWTASLLPDCKRSLLAGATIYCQHEVQLRLKELSAEICLADI